MRYEELSEDLMVNEESPEFRALLEAVQENVGEEVPDMDAAEGLEFFKGIL